MNTDPNPTPPEPSPAPPDTPQAAPDSEENKEPNRNRRTISNLPLALRDKVGCMMLDGVAYADIIASLGEAGKNIIPRHITNWKNGTFNRWRDDYERRQVVTERTQTAKDLVDRAEGTALPEAGLRVAALQMNEFLLAFQPATFADALTEKPELYLRLINTMSRVNESTVMATRMRAQQAAPQAKKQTSLGGKPDNIAESENMTEITHRLNLL